MFSQHLVMLVGIAFLAVHTALAQTTDITPRPLDPRVFSQSVANCTAFNRALGKHEDIQLRASLVYNGVSNSDPHG